MQDFCKVLNHDKYGQVLIVLDTDDESRPSVKFSMAPEGLGVCSVTSSFRDSDVGWDMAEEAFGNSDMDMALKALAPVVDMADAMAGWDD